MKICLYNVTTAVKIGGIETFCWEMGRALSQLGHKVELLTGKGEEIKYPELKIKTFDFREREKFPDFGRRFRKFMERLSFFFHAKKYLKQISFDVLVVLKPFDFFATKYIKKFHPQCTTVFISGGEDFWWFDKRFSKSIDLMFSVSRANAEIIKNRYKREEVKILPNGVNPEEFRPNPEISANMKRKLGIAEKKVLLSVGRVVGLKGYQLVIKALKKLEEEFVYVLIGDGEYLPKLKELARELGVEKRVFFLGKKPHKDLPVFYLLGDVFIQPSIGHEAFGITVIEAMSCGLPVVGSKSGGIKELIKEGWNGFLFKKGNVEELEKKIRRAYELRENLGKNARSFVEQNFSWDKIARKFVKMIRSQS